MKNLFIAGLITLFGVQSFAQDEPRELSEDCKKYLSLMGTYGEQGMWRDAADFFVKAHKACGEDKLDQTDWKNARAVYSKLLAAEKDTVKIKGIKDTIDLAYKTELKYFNTPKLSADYASRLVKGKSKNIDQIDTLYNASIHKLKEKLSVNHIIYYYIHLIGKFNTADGDQKDSARNVAIDEYLLLSDYISGAKKKYKDNEKAIKSYNKAQGYLDNYFSKLAKDCEMLTEVLGSKIESLPVEKEEKLSKVQTYLSLLERRKCDQTDLYGQLADILITIDPSASAYYSQGNFFTKRDEHKKAITYFKKAIEMAGETGENIDQYNFSLASALYTTKSYRAAFSNAKKVNGENKGKAMKICAGSIGAIANSCGDTTFERKANNWLADDYMKRASALGEEYKSTYANRAPTTTEIFEAGKKNGESISLKCWGESTTIR